MLIAESEWVGKALRSLPDDAFPLANVGCQTVEFRTITQPWIEENIFGPLDAAGRKVVHVDIRPDVGVDLVADVTTAEGQAAIRERGARTILCANLLEHVPDAAAVLADLKAAVPIGGYLLVTGPLGFPYHPDPIDTMFRPTAAEMTALIGPSFEVVESRDIVCHRMSHYYAMRPLGGLRLAARLAVPFVRYEQWKERATWAFKHASAYAVLARRVS
jgi:hypothetical protein